MATKESGIRNLAERERTYKQAIVRGEVGATRDLFDLYHTNKMYAKAAELSQASYALGIACLNGTHPKSYRMALALFEYASDLGGHFESMCFLFNHYACMGMGKDNPKFLKLSANLYKLAEIYQVMAKTNPDRAFMHYDRAIELYDRARKLGSVDAIYQLAQCYENSPVPQYDLAIELYELASQRDHISAMYRLCEIYLDNSEQVDPQRCIHLANKLYESAQFYQHIPDANNQKQAIKLSEYASRLGHKGAIDCLASRELVELPFAHAALKPNKTCFTNLNAGSSNKENISVNMLINTKAGYFNPVPAKAQSAKPMVTSITPMTFGY